MDTGDLLAQWFLPVVGVLLAVVGIALTLRSRQRRVLRYSFPVRRLVFSNSFLAPEGFDLRLNGQPVRDLFLVNLRIDNVGNQVIRAEDLRRPLRLVFDRTVQFSPLRITRDKQDIPLVHHLGEDGDQSFIEIGTELIEPGDSILLEFLYEAETYARYDLDGRIVNGRLARKYIYEESVDEDYRYGLHRFYRRKSDFPAMLVTMLFALLGALGGTGLAKLLRLPESTAPLVSGIGAAVGFVIGMIVANKTVDRRFREMRDREIEARVQNEMARARLLDRSDNDAEGAQPEHDAF